ncbi:MAG: transcription termination factor Rho [Planctomycetota bacterium]
MRQDIQNLDDAERNEIYEAAKAADYEIPKLQAMPMARVLELAQREGIEGYSGLGKQELIFQLLKHRVTSTGLGWGEGVLDILPDGFGFLRSPRYSYTAGPDDIYVSPSQIRRLNLKQGQLLAGPVRPPKDGEKYFALLHIEAVNAGTVEQLRQRIPFDDLTPLLPEARLQLEFPGCGSDIRLLDFLAPLGKGQRVLVYTPPLAGRTLLFTHLAQAILANHPEAYVILLMVDERPEDITEMRRQTGPDHRREVVATSFDEPASRHVALAEIVTEKARRITESGGDVVILMDSITELVRAYNTEVPHSGKILSAGLDAVALQRPKRLLSSARNSEEAGSLTVIASVLTDSGSHMNDVICEEFRGKANSEIVLDQELAELHIYPALDVGRTGTRREDLLLSAGELASVQRLRKHLAGLSKQEALERLLEGLAASESNSEFLGGTT